MICGLVQIFDEEYMFRLEGGELHAEAIANIGKGYIIPAWLKKRPSFNGEYLLGVNQITGKRIAFKTATGEVGLRNTELIIKIQYYLELSSDDDRISRIVIKADELNYIYNVSNAIEAYSFEEEGTTSCKTKTFEETTSDKELFICCGKSVEVLFTIYRGIQFNSCTPINLSSSMVFEFEATNDYDFIFRVVGVAKLFISYLCYRRNIQISDIIIQSRREDGRYQNIGIMYHPGWQEKKTENSKIIEKNHIAFEGIKGHVGEILQDLEDGILYTRHLPEDYKDSKRINHSKFIMVTAAVEWIIKVLYPNGIEHSKKTKEAIEQVKKELDVKIKSTSCKVKDQYKHLRDVLEYDSLSVRINKICNDYEELITPFGKFLYEINYELDNFDYLKISQRIEKQRNDFAHGNLDEEYDMLATLDIILLERVVYILQLSKYGIEKEKIISEVKRIFGMNF